MHSPAMSSGEYMMRAYRAAQQQAINQYYSQGLASIANLQAPNPAAAPEERPAEDVTGLRMLDEFLAKRREGKNET